MGTFFHRITLIGPSGATEKVEALHGGFDRRPFDERSEEMVWVLRGPSLPSVVE